MELLQKIRDFLADLEQKTKSGRGLWLTGLSLVVLLGLFAIGKAFGHDDTQATRGQWLLWLVGEASAIGITAIIVGAVLKVLAVEGYFKSALVELFEGDRWIESLSAEARIKLWHRLTRKIYIPSLEPATAQHPEPPELAGFRARMSAAISASFSYQGREYMRNFNSDIVIRWEDEAMTRVSIATHASCELVPFDPAAPATWITERTPEPHLSLDDYTKSKTELKIDDDPPAGSPEVKVVGRTERTIYTFKGKNSYKLAYREQVSWTLDKDPSMIRTSILVYDGYTLRIENQAKELRVIFVEVGGNDLYDLLSVGDGGTDDCIEYGEFKKRQSKRVLLPGQGYQMIFVRNPTASAVSPRP